MENEPAS